MKKRKRWLITLAAAVLIIIGIGGKQYMDKKAIEKDYQQGIDLIQKYVSNYLVENYEGIEKIEWQGVGVEWRNAKGYGPSLLGNYVDSDVRIYVYEDNYFTITFLLNDETEYNEQERKYVKLDYLNPENLDISIGVGKENGIYGYSDDPQKDVLKVTERQKKEIEKVIKNSDGSLEAKIIYNLNIYELKY
ncbi:hypothetical protein [Enterococcus faecalis]|uniref:hypothetical protein n=1 Tax=Enterococcus faecalis TaxID=1351 RepID=UPI0008152966|nr:hypothetical protein [Enterococcus faecalis]BAV36994.1 hypothetical protein EFW11_1755 [Enterococcus faecalis]